jgi:hypothetical protein
MPVWRAQTAPDRRPRCHRRVIGEQPTSPASIPRTLAATGDVPAAGMVCRRRCWP